MGFHSIRLYLSTTTEYISVSANKPDCKNWSPGHNSRDSFSPEMILKRQEATEIFLEVPVGPPVKMTGPVPGVYPAAGVVALQISWMMLLSLKKTWPSVALIWINHAVLRCSQLTSTQARLWTAVLIWSSSTQTLLSGWICSGGTAPTSVQFERGTLLYRQILCSFLPSLLYRKRMWRKDNIFVSDEFLARSHYFSSSRKIKC